MLKNTPLAGNHMAVVSTLSGATQAAAADFTSVDNNLGPRFGVVLRYQDPLNYYLVYRQVGGSSRLLISRFVNGVEKILASPSIANPTRNVSFRLTGRGSDGDDAHAGVERRREGHSHRLDLRDGQSRNIDRVRHVQDGATQADNFTASVQSVQAPDRSNLVSPRERPGVRAVDVRRPE